MTKQTRKLNRPWRYAITTPSIRLKEAMYVKSEHISAQVPVNVEPSRVYNQAAAQHTAD